MKQSSSSRTTLENNFYYNYNYSSSKNILSLHHGDVDGDDDGMMSMAAILLQLKNQDLEYGLPYSWGRKGRRSAIDLTPPPSPPALPEQPPREWRGAAEDGGGEGREVEERVSLAREPMKEKEKKATSPSTPLSFSPSESDDKSIRPTSSSSSKIFSNKGNEELLHEVSKLTETRDTLKREIEIVRQYYEEQRALNMKLKAKKIKLSISHDKEIPSYMEMNSEGLNLAIELAQPQVRTHPLPTTTTSFQGQSQPLITDLRLHPTAGVTGMSYNELQSHVRVGHSSSSGLGSSVKQRGPRDRVPDLNLTSDETHDVDHLPPLDGVPRGTLFLSTDWSRAFSGEAIAKAQAAEARKNRMQICKVKIKNSVAALKSRHGHR